MVSCRELKWDTDDSFTHLFTTLLVLADWNGEQCHSFYRHLTENKQNILMLNNCTIQTITCIFICWLVQKYLVDQPNLVTKKPFPFHDIKCSWYGNVDTNIIHMWNSSSGVRWTAERKKVEVVSYTENKWNQNISSKYRNATKHVWCCYHCKMPYKNIVFSSPAPASDK